MSRVTIVAARARNGIIGREGDLPWRLGSDMKRFRALTMGKPVVMGRKTWDSLPRKPLDGRANIVLTRDARFCAPGAFIYSDLALALAAARAMADAAGVEEACVIGGAGVFAEAMAQATRLVLTEIDLDAEGDVRFPAFDEGAWREIAREDVAQGAKDDAGFTIRTLERA